MTREEAIKKHRELWHWIADETRRRKDCDVQKGENPDVAKEGPMNSCWLCEYSSQFNKVCRVCTVCPINWGVKTCMKKGSPYMSWTFNTFLDYEERAKLADRIAELPEKGGK